MSDRPTDADIVNYIAFLEKALANAAVPVPIQTRLLVVHVWADQVQAGQGAADE